MGTAAILGVIATGLITRPLAEVRTAARKMASGRLDARARPRGALELRELATDFNAMAASLAEERAELMTLQRNLETMVAERTTALQRKQQEMELFFYTVSHDIKSSIITITGFVQLAEEEVAKKNPGQGELREYLSRANRANESLQKLIVELMEFARVEQQEPTYRIADVTHVAEAVFAELRVLAKSRGVELLTAGPPLEIETDVDRLRHAITNIAHNAITYMPAKDGASVLIWWDRNDDDLVLRVQDNGAGMSKELEGALFQPFANRRLKKRNHGGSGLGLSITKRLVEGLGGSISVTSQEGIGTTFTIRLPLRHEMNGDHVV